MMRYMRTVKVQFSIQRKRSNLNEIWMEAWWETTYAKYFSKNQNNAKLDFHEIAQSAEAIGLPTGAVATP